MGAYFLDGGRKGMPLRMTPDFEDLSCEFVFGQAAVPVEDDPLMQEVRIGGRSSLTLSH